MQTSKAIDPQQVSRVLIDLKPSRMHKTVFYVDEGGLGVRSSVRREPFQLERISHGYLKSP